MEKTKDIVKEFWDRYTEANILERQNIISKMGLVRELINLDFPDLKEGEDKNKEIREHMLTQMLMSYFDDLIDYMAEKHERNNV